MHFGEITYGVDERAEVGLLSRNIKIEGTIEDSCYGNTPEEKDLCTKFQRDTFGGHLKVSLSKQKKIHFLRLHVLHAVPCQRNTGCELLILY